MKGKTASVTAGVAEPGGLVKAVTLADAPEAVKKDFNMIGFAKIDDKPAMPMIQINPFDLATGSYFRNQWESMFREVKLHMKDNCNEWILTSLIFLLSHLSSH